MKLKKKSVILVPHSKECFENRFCGIIQKSYFGNFNANEAVRHGKHHYWHVVVCNDPKCNALKAVHSNVLANA